MQDKRWSNRKEKLEADMKILQNKVKTNDAIVYKARWFIMARHEQKNIVIMVIMVYYVPHIIYHDDACL